MKYAVCFCDLIKVRGEWETAVRANDRGVIILTPPRPTMDGSANPGFRLVRYDDIEDHISIAAVPGAIEALGMIASGRIPGEFAKDTPEQCANKEYIPDDPMFGYVAAHVAETALRAVRGEESA